MIWKKKKNRRCSLLALSGNLGACSSMHVWTSMGLTVSHPSIKQHHWLTESHKQRACCDIHLSDRSRFTDWTATNSKATVQAKARFECTVTYHTQQFKTGGEACEKHTVAAIPIIRFRIKLCSILFSFPEALSYMDVYNLRSRLVPPTQKGVRFLSLSQCRGS